MKRFLKNHSLIISTLQKYHEPLLLGIIVLISLLLFKDFINNYFFQDDFFLLSISHVNKFSDFINFFIPRSDVQFYRPISHQLFYYLARSLLGLNPTGYHIVTFVFFSLNIILVHQISKKFLSSKLLQFIIALFYASSVVHFDSLFWIANFSYVLVSFFFLLGFLLYISSNLKNRNLILITIFLLGLLANEFMITFPLVILAYKFLNLKKGDTHKSPILSLFLIAAFYIFFRFLLFYSDTSSYKYIIDKRIFLAYRWYLLFFVNWAETMKDQMLNLYLVQDKFLQSFSFFVKIFFINLFIFLVAFLVTPALYLIKKKKLSVFITTKWKVSIFFLIWIIVTLGPIVAIPSQISPHRGSLGFVGFLLFFFLILDFTGRNMKINIFLIITIIATSVWVISSYYSIRLNKIVHWTYNRPRISKYWIDKVLISYPNIKKNSVLVLNTEGNEEKISLDKGRAFNVIYNDNSLRIFFSTNSAEYKGSIFVE